MHFDFQQAIAGAGLAPAAPDVEAEPPLSVAPALGLLGGGEQIPDVVEQAGVGGWVGAGRPPNGTLVDVHHLVQLLDALDAVALAGADLHPHQLRPQPLEEHLVYKGALSAAGHAGDHRKGAQGELHVDMPEIILRRADDLQNLAVSGTANGGHLNFLLSGQILPRQTVGVSHHLRRSACCHHLTAVNTGAGADVDEVIGGPHGVLVMLHHDETVAQIPEVFQRCQQLIVVPLVQPDGRLV